MNLWLMAAGVPDYDGYLTVDELFASTRQLAADFPGIVSLAQIGKSRQGDPIDLITIGDGPLRALWVGGGHPNEPLGCRVIDYFARRLAEDSALRESLGYTWYFIPVLDPDAMRRNEAWFKGPFTLTHYARHFFRPPVVHQPEFNLPVQYKTLRFEATLPETLALQHALNTIQPDFFYSLHHGNTGGVFYSLSEEAEALYPTLQEITEYFNQVYIDESQLKAEGAGTRLARGVYLFEGGVKNHYDGLAAQGVGNPAEFILRGADALEYLQGTDTFSLVAEVDLRTDRQVADNKSTRLLIQDAYLQGQRWRGMIDTWLEETLAPAIQELTLPTTFEYIGAVFQQAAADHGIQAQVAQNHQMPAEESATESTLRRATQAEVFTHLIQTRIAALTKIGLYIGLLDEEIAAGNDQPVIESAYTALTERFAAIADGLETDLNYRITPIRELIGFQLCAGIATAAYIRDEREKPGAHKHARFSDTRDPDSTVQPSPGSSSPFSLDVAGWDDSWLQGTDLESLGEGHADFLDSLEETSSGAAAESVNTPPGDSGQPEARQDAAHARFKPTRRAEPGETLPAGSADQDVASLQTGSSDRAEARSTEIHSKSDNK